MLSSNHFKLAVKAQRLIYLYKIDFGEKVRPQDDYIKRAAMRGLRGEL